MPRKNLTKWTQVTVLSFFRDRLMAVPTSLAMNKSEAFLILLHLWEAATPEQREIAASKARIEIVEHQQPRKRKGAKG